jgi:DNA-binding CsgD family transcriptional regulator
MHKQQFFNFLNYLGTNPRIHDVCTHLFNDFSISQNPDKIRILWKGANNTLSTIGEHGFEYTNDRPRDFVGKSFPYEQWSTSETEGYEVVRGKIEGPWSALGNVYVHKIMQDYTTVGYVRIIFNNMTDAKRAEFEESTQMLLPVLTLYVNLEMQRIAAMALVDGQIKIETPRPLDARTRFGLLTNRQVEILRMIGQEKTNAQIGKFLGYATTTIHAECSDIYQTLAVGNRTQAYDLVSEFL